MTYSVSIIGILYRQHENGGDYFNPYLQTWYPTEFAGPTVLDTVIPEEEAQKKFPTAFLTNNQPA